MIIFRLTCLVGYPRTSAPEPKIEETFYSYATGNIYYTIQKNYNEVKSSTSLVCAVFNFLKSNMQNTLHPSSFP